MASYRRTQTAIKTGARGDPPQRPLHTVIRQHGMHYVLVLAAITLGISIGLVVNILAWLIGLVSGAMAHG